MQTVKAVKQEIDDIADVRMYSRPGPYHFHASRDYFFVLTGPFECFVLENQRGGFFQHISAYGT